MTVANESVATLPTSRIWLRGAIAAVVAAALNTIVAALEVSAFSLSPAQLSMQAGPVIALTIVGILAGTGVFVMLRRRGPTGERLFVIIAVIVGALSLLLPVAMMVGLELAQAYPVIAWLCWLPNLVVAQLLITRSDARRSRRGESRPAIR